MTLCIGISSMSIVTNRALCTHISTGPRISCTGPKTKRATSSLLTSECNCYHFTTLRQVLIFSSAKHLHTPEEQLHSLAGSFGYVAPEVLLKQGHGKPVDIWAIGYVFYTTLSARLQISTSFLVKRHHIRRSMWIFTI